MSSPITASISIHTQVKLRICDKGPFGDVGNLIARAHTDGCGRALASPSRGDAGEFARPSPSGGIAPDCRMNLAPDSVEHSHGDRAGRPGHVGDKFERAHAASRVGAQFSNNIRRAVKILDSVLHFRDPRAPSILVEGSVANLLLRCALPRTSTAAGPNWRPPRDKKRGPPAVRGRYAPHYRRSSPANSFLKTA